VVLDFGFYFQGRLSPSEISDNSNALLEAQQVETGNKQVALSDGHYGKN
jgi:hypothetical protein